jgi:hypothetical protein
VLHARLAHLIADKVLQFIVLTSFGWDESPSARPGLSQKNRNAWQDYATIALGQAGGRRLESLNSDASDAGPPFLVPIRMAETLKNTREEDAAGCTLATCSRPLSWRERVPGIIGVLQHISIRLGQTGLR